MTSYSLLPTPSSLALCSHAGIEVPLICGAMYPCSNPELVAAVSEAGAIGIVQPISLTYVYRHDFREGLRLIRQLTGKPFGLNALIERSSKRYHEKMVRWVETALEEGVRFFITSLGNPRWVCERVQPPGGIVYHDVTERKWALKGRDAGVDGLIGVNHRAGGHPGPRSAEALLEEVGDLGLPIVCAGGIGDAAGFAAALRMGYAGVQMGTRFIATVECGASEAYKQAILDAKEADIVLTGVSRTSKTPLSMYLAQRGYKTGNVPIVPGIEPPRELIEMDPRKVIGLIIEPNPLLEIRKARIRQIGASPYTTYAEPAAVVEELQRARRLFNARQWRSVNTTGKAISQEPVASETS